MLCPGLIDRPTDGWYWIDVTRDVNSCWPLSFCRAHHSNSYASKTWTHYIISFCHAFSNQKFIIAPSNHSAYKNCYLMLESNSRMKKKTFTSNCSSSHPILIFIGLKIKNGFKGRRNEPIATKLMSDHEREVWFFEVKSIFRFHYEWKWSWVHCSNNHIGFWFSGVS